MALTTLTYSTMVLTRGLTLPWIWQIGCRFIFTLVSFLCSNQSIILDIWHGFCICIHNLKNTNKLIILKNWILAHYNYIYLTRFVIICCRLPKLLPSGRGVWVMFVLFLCHATSVRFINSFPNWCYINVCSWKQHHTPTKLLTIRCDIHRCAAAWKDLAVLRPSWWAVIYMQGFHRESNYRRVWWV